MFIGGFTDATWFGGQVDELRIWRAVRTAGQIESARTHPLTGEEPDLIGYWPFDALAGTAVTDFAGVAQYGEFVGGVYRTADAAPLDVCVTTDDDGSYDIQNIRYNENGTAYRVRPSLPRHEFSPPVQTITLNSGHPVENRVNFNDVSSYTLSGRVQFAGTDCYERDVHLYIDGKSAGIADKNGKFALTTDEGVHTVKAVLEDYSFWVVVGGDTTESDSVDVDVTDNIPNIVIINTTRHTVSGKVGGGCDQYVGDVTIRYRSASSCLDSSFVQQPEYSLSLPPTTYFASATVDPATIPDGLSKSDVVSFFQNLGERELDLSAVADTTLDFVYRAPLRVSIEGFEPYVDPDCQLVLEDGTPLPDGLPVLPQLEFVDLVIHVDEVYSGSVCPLDSGSVVVTDEIADRENDPDTLTVIDGVATYRAFASTPSLIVGRMDGSNDRSYQKALTATAMVEGRDPVSQTTWALVTGHVAPPGAEFVTYTADIPLHILRDPPGDGSYAYLERGFKACARIGLSTSLTFESGVELTAEYGLDAKTFAFWGVPEADAKAAATLDSKFLIGSTITSDLNTEVCLATKERFSTSSDDALVGAEGDVFIGTGVNFLFTEAGTINVDDNCRVIRGTTVAYEPDSVKTAYAYTEKYIRDVLIPDLEAKADELADSRYGPSYTAQAENWQAILDRNDDLKRNALTARNRSFSGGASYEHTNEGVASASLGGSIKLYSKLENKGGVESDLNIFGAKVKASLSAIINVTTEVTASASGSTEATEAVGYVLSDDDVGDNFSVDVKYGGGYITPIFAVRAGKSSCPYEPWPDLDTGDPAMVARDRMALRVAPQQPDEIPPPDEPAVLKLTLENHSDETRDYVLRSLSVSNPGGAILMVNGSPISSGLLFTIAPESAHEATLSVERGPTQYYYGGLQLELDPACGADATGGVTTFNVAFQTDCSDISLFSPESGWQYNESNENASDTIEMILTDYETEVSPIDSLRVTKVGVQYRRLGVDREGPGPWTDVFADSVGSVETLLAWKPDASLSDGVYELRAFAVCNTGGRGYSSVATGTIDRHAPQAFGTPEPADGVLSLGEDIGVTFNEPIDCRSIDAASVALTYADGPDAGSSVAVHAVCNGSAVVIVPDVADEALEGRRLTASVDGVLDPVGNAMDAPVTWDFEFRRSLFAWTQSRISKDIALGDPGTLDAVLANGTAQPVDFAVSAMPAFLSVAPGEGAGRIAPGATRTVEFDIDAAIAGGAHQGQVTVTATDTTGADTTGVAVMSVYFDVACVPPTWTVNPADFEYSMSMVARMEVDGTGAPLEADSDRLAAFVGNELRGVASPVDIGGPRVVFLTVYSNRPANETVRFQAWDDDQCKLYPGTIERFPFSADSIIGSASLPVTLTATESPSGQAGEFVLNAGWNWFSTNVTSADMSVVNVLSTLSPSEGDIIKSKTAFASFDPATPAGWVGTLSTLDNVSGYMIRLSNAGTIIQDGSIVDPTSTGIPVGTGWNWIAYASGAQAAVATALADLGGQGLVSSGDVIRGQSAFAQWDAGWLGSLDTMEPGQGYRLFLQGGPGTFHYPAIVASPATVAGTGRGQPPPAKPTAARAGWAAEPNRYQYNMTMIAAVKTDGVDWNNADDVVGAFVGAECRGLASPMHIDGIETPLVFMMVYGNRVDGETVTFRAYDARNGLTYDVGTTVPFESDGALGTASSPMTLSTGSVRDGMPTAFRLMQNHPNPFNPATTIRFELPRPGRVVLTIYNVSGQRVRTLVNRDYGPGRYRASWDGVTDGGGRASSGVYFYRLTAGPFSSVRKMVLLK